MSRIQSSKGWIIFGNYGTHNIGDAAMLLGLMTGLRKKQPSVPITIISKDTHLPSYLQPLNIRLIPPTIKIVLLAIFNAQGVILGGGTHFHDDYITARYRRHLFYMLRYTLLLFLCKLLGKKIYLVGIGLGPIRLFPTRVCARLSCLLADHVTVRDQVSYDHARQWLTPTRLTRAFDLAGLLAIENEVSLSRPAVLPNRHRLGISLMSIANIPLPQPNASERFQAAFENAISALSMEKPALDITIFVFRGVWKRDSDVEASEKLYQTLTRQGRGRVTLICEDDPTLVLAQMRQCDSFLAVRYHSAVLAYLARLPFIIINYHEKCAELARTINHPELAQLSLADVIDGRLTTRLANLLDQAECFYPGLDLAQACASSQQNISILPNLNA